MSNDYLPDSIKNILSKILKIILTNETNTISILDDVDVNLRDLSTCIRNESDLLLEKKEYKEASDLYLKVSAVLDEIKNNTKNIEIKEFLNKIASVLVAHSSSLKKYTIHQYINEAQKCQKSNNYEMATSYKNQASAIEYETENEIYDRYIQLEAKNFVNQNIREYSMEKELKHQVNWFRDFFAKRFPNIKEVQKQEKTLEEKIPDKNDTDDTNINISDAIRIEQKVDKASEEWFDWSVYLEPVDRGINILNQIESVKYHLHPTFPDPKPITNANNNFKLDANGWGEFEIKADIKLKNGQKITKYHWLKFNK